jgi:hypothetical protein
MNLQNNQSMTDMVQTIGKLAMAQQQLAHKAEQKYAPEVEAILRDQCREPQRIEFLLDGILDFCFDDEMLRLYKKLCRYYFEFSLNTVFSYVNAYREMWSNEKSLKGG